MAIKYVSSTGTGTDDGTSATHTTGTTGPWTLAQMLAATPAAGDELRVMATGTYARSATGTVAYANGTAAANVLVTGANSGGTVDGTRPTIQAGAGSITLLNVTGSHIRVESLILDGNSQTSVTGLTLGASYTRARKVKATGCTAKGINLADNGNSAALVRCEATACSGTCGIYVGNDTSGAQFCESYANTTHGFQVGFTAPVLGCVSSANTGSSSDGFNCASVGVIMDRCVAYGNGRHGFDLTGNAGFGSYLSNCLAYGQTAVSAEGFSSDAVKSGAFLLNCAGGNNTSNYNATNLVNVTGFVTLTGDPFTAAGSGDFGSNNTAGAGAAVRAAGFPGLLPRGTTTGYSDVGVAPHADPASSGSVVTHPFPGAAGAAL